MTWRSVLFTPGDRIDRVRKAWDSGAADVVVADLEDAVAPAAKAAARDGVVQLLRDVPTATCTRAVRINAGPMGEADLAAVLGANPDLVVIPKAEEVEGIERLASTITAAGSSARLLLILETATGVLNARQLAACSRVDAIAFGAEDLAADAGLRRTPDNAEVSVPRALVSLAAAEAGIAAIDMITADFRDVERTGREATEARNLGYQGKMCLHPLQVAAVHAAFAPTPEELAWAHAVVEAVDAAGAEEGGIVVVEGKMVDVPVIRQARRLLASASTNAPQSP